MKQKEVFKKIGGIIHELSEQYEYLETVVDNLNDLELELFVSNAHFLTDHIEILCKLNLQNRPKRPLTEKQETTTGEQKFFEPVVQQMKPGADIKESKATKSQVKYAEAGFINKPEEDKPLIQEYKPEEEQQQPEEPAVPQFDFTSEAPEDTYSFIREEPETIRHELILDEAETFEENEETPPVEEKKADEAEIETDETAPVTDEVSTVENAEEKTAENVEEKSVGEVKAEEPQPDKETREEKTPAEEPVNPEEAEVITRNQKMSAHQNDKASAKSEQVSIKPISDIKLAITLNDKLLYVKDLFNGYNLAYSEAVEILNRFSTFEEAQRFLKTNYVVKNNWDSKQVTADKFYALLKRRYA